MRQIRVSDYIASHLEKIGVTHIFLLSGGGMMHLQDAVFRNETLKYICSNHEQSCAYGAEAYARTKQGLGVCYATSGPGGANTVTGIIQAWLDSVPVLFITGQAKSSETIRGSGLFGLRQFGTFEVDIIPIVQSITKYSVFVDDPGTIKYHLEKAIATAQTGRPGPVLLDIPLNVQGALITPESQSGFSESGNDEPELSPKFVDEIIEKLQQAQRPLILAGHGIRAAGQVTEFRQVAAALNVPVSATQLANDLLPHEHPLFVGRPGIKGDRAGGLAVQNADLILTLGCSLHSMTTGYELDLFAPSAYKIQVDIDKMVLKRENVGVNLKVNASVNSFIKALNISLEKTKRTPVVPRGQWHNPCLEWKRDLAITNEARNTPAGEIDYYDVINSLSELCEGTEIIVADAGSAFYVTGQAFRSKERQRVILAGAMAQMGYTTAAVVGASVAAPERLVIGITGDGSFQTNMHDLGVIAYHNLNVKLIVVNNGGYVSIRNTQNNYFHGKMDAVDSKTGVFMPRIDRLCDAYGIPYTYCEDPNMLRLELNRVLGQCGPQVFEIRTAYRQEIIPSVMSERLADGTMQSRPLQDMYPYLPSEQLAEYMKVSSD